MWGARGLRRDGLADGRGLCGAGVRKRGGRAGHADPGGAQADSENGGQARQAPPPSAKAARPPRFHAYIRQDRLTNTLEPGVL
ncbi:hypothetical protein GCM10009108_19880 [Castellaniella ginsengisoli]|uniref:Uncharacterized protein n=1 Tax=Castellaniella ginsengisoli TaxID=546114 RepID=A0ABN1L026_9BURK